MNYKEFYNALEEIKIISPIWNLELDFISNELGKIDKIEEVLSLFAIYFSLIGDGNLFMYLDLSKLKNKWESKLDETLVRLQEKNDSYTDVIKKLKDYSLDLYKSLALINEANLNKIVGSDKLFIIEDNKLFLRKYYNSRKNIIEKIKNLYRGFDKREYDVSQYDKYMGKFKLKERQADIVKKGVYNNLLVTGGPGTGKTTSVIYLLIALLEEAQKADKQYNIYITATSGKAASRMKESIKGSLEKNLAQLKIDNPDVYNILETLEGVTIHRLLGYNGEFRYNKNNQFDSNSIFVIDEASMIDATIFSALLEAIPNAARVFILGDKDQLPSVECGAVFGDLLKCKSLSNFIVRLNETNRFDEDSKVYKLAQEINDDNKALDSRDFIKYDTDDFNNVSDGDDDMRYYDDENGKNDKENISKIITDWSKKYLKDVSIKSKDGKLEFQGIVNICTDIDYNDDDRLKLIFDQVDYSKILCAENDSERGVKKINRAIDKYLFKPSDISVCGFHVGEILMINRNDYQLDLYNGDMGIVVKFEDDPMLYFMVSKDSQLPLFRIKKDNKIFTKSTSDSKYVFYPIHMISKDEIDLAFAITIHKSQGSDYRNILVVLPSKSGHPLLNRQIVYTAITRTKGNTFIYSNMDNLRISKDRIITRDTDINL